MCDLLASPDPDVTKFAKYRYMCLSGAVQTMKYSQLTILAGGCSVLSFWEISEQTLRSGMVAYYEGATPADLIQLTCLDSHDLSGNKVNCARKMIAEGTLEPLKAIAPKCQGTGYVDTRV
jgi:hypothetical protein